MEAVIEESRCPGDPLGRSVCARQLVDLSAAQGAEVHVSTSPPLMQGPYEVARFRCPHGVDYWAVPTAEQQADWVARRVE